MVARKFTGETAAVPGEHLFAHIMAAVNNLHLSNLNISNVSLRSRRQNFAR